MRPRILITLFLAAGCAVGLHAQPGYRRSSSSRSTISLEERWVRPSLTMEASLGTSMNYSAGVEVRFSYYRDIFNLVTGVRFNCRTLNCWIPSDTYSSIHSGYLSIPALFRINYAHRPVATYYFGAGPEFTVLPVYGYFKGSGLYRLDDRKLLRPVNVSPKITFGMAYGHYFEAEFFVMADIRGHYDRDYFDGYVLEDGTPLRDLCDNKVYHLFIDPDFLERMNVGIAIRINLR